MNIEDNISMQVAEDSEAGDIDNQKSPFIIISRNDYNNLINKGIYNKMYIITEEQHE